MVEVAPPVALALDPTVVEARLAFQSALGSAAVSLVLQQQE